MSRGSWCEVDAVEEVAFAEHSQSVVVEGEITSGPGADGLRQEAEGFADGNVVRVPAMVENEEGGTEEQDDGPELWGFHTVFLLPGAMSRMRRCTR